MSAEFGLVFNLIFFSGFWTILGVMVDKFVPVFNRTCSALNCMQDGVETFGMLLVAWSVILVVIWVGCLINYIIVKNNSAIANMEV